MAARRRDSSQAKKQLANWENELARYFFHIDGDRPHPDDFGEELIDDARAWTVALRTVRDLDDGFKPGQNWRLEVWREREPLYNIMVQSRRVSRL